MLPEFDINPIRPEKERGVDQEVFYPDWQCFCCHDSGLVDPRLTKLVIKKYDYWRDKRAVCQRCDKGTPYDDDYRNYEMRFSKQICNELDTIERQEWADFAKTQQEQIKRVDLTLLTKNMTMPGSRDRADNEEREVRLRKEEVDSL